MAVAVAALVAMAGTQYSTPLLPSAAEEEAQTLVMAVVTVAAVEVGSMGHVEGVACSHCKMVVLACMGVVIQEGAAPAPAHGTQVVVAVQEVLGSVARAACAATAELVWRAISLGRSFIMQEEVAVTACPQAALEAVATAECKACSSSSSSSSPGSQHKGDSVVQEALADHRWVALLVA